MTSILARPSTNGAARGPASCGLLEGERNNPAAGEPPSNDSATYQYDGTTLAVLERFTSQPEWLVQRLLVQDQPAVLGGPKKALKTSVGIDLAVSLATATPFLGRFQVCNRHRVAFISGESGAWTITDSAHRISSARGINGSHVDGLLFDFMLPQLGRLSDLEALGHGLREDAVDVVMIDPLYLCLLSGTDVQASNTFDMGPLMQRIGQRCLEAGATPIFLHHARKGLAAGSPMELEDLTFAGIAEYARQWFLLNRREKFDPDSGTHRLWFSIGGSCGQAGLWAVDIDEGHLDENFQGRKWEVTVQSSSEAAERARKSRADSKKDTKRNQEDAEERGLLDALDYLAPNGASAGTERVRQHSGFGREKFGAIVARLVRKNMVTEITVKVKLGRGGTRPAAGIRRATNDHLSPPGEHLSEAADVTDR